MYNGNNFLLLVQQFLLLVQAYRYFSVNFGKVYNPKFFYSIFSIESK